MPGFLSLIKNKHLVLFDRLQNDFCFPQLVEHSIVLNKQSDYYFY